MSASSKYCVQRYGHNVEENAQIRHAHVLVLSVTTQPIISAEFFRETLSNKVKKKKHFTNFNKI